MWNRFSFIWPRRPPSGPLPNPHPPLFPHQTTLQTGGSGQGGGRNVFCPVWCDCLQRNGLTLPSNATHTRTHSLWTSWRCVRQTCWVQEVWDPVTTSCRQRTEDAVSWSQDGTIMSRPATTATSFQVLLKPSPLTFPLMHAHNQMKSYSPKSQTQTEKQIN